MSASRPRIAVVTRTWGGEDDGAAVTRLVAGALAIHGDVEIIHPTDVDEITATADSVFAVHSVPLVGARPVRAAIARAATEAGGHDDLPSSVVDLIDRWEGSAPGVEDVLRKIAPDVVVLAGASQPFDLAVLDGSGPTRPRVLYVPMLGGTATTGSPRFAATVAAADVIGSIHPGEDRVLRAQVAATTPVVALDVALPLNRSATSQGLFGVGWFGRYVVMIRRFPANGGRYAHSVTHDVMRGALGKIAVAEVDGTRWRISDAVNTAELPVNPTRVNLWRLMANGTMTIDLRPADLFGREAIESMMLGTPVVVPEGSAAMEHVAAASGGLWYRNLGEVLDTARAVLDGGTYTRLGRQGREYADTHHGDMDAFVARVGELIAR